MRLICDFIKLRKLALIVKVEKNKFLRRNFRYYDWGAKLWQEKLLGK